MKFYERLIQLKLMYAAETLGITKKKEESLRIMEKQIMRMKNKRRYSKKIKQLKIKQLGQKSWIKFDNI